MQEKEPLTERKISVPAGIAYPSLSPLYPPAQLNRGSELHPIIQTKVHSMRNWNELMAVEATNEVNSWAEKETNGLIKEVLPSGSVDSSTRLILANALYNGEWNEKFDVSKTKDHDFHLLNESSVQVPFMTSKKKQLVSAFDGFKVMGLPYKQGEDKRRFSMYFFLPDAKDGLPALWEKEVEVGDFRVPKFQISFGFEASKVLKGLGLVLPFSGEGLTEMVDSPVGRDLYVSSIFHKSFIEVNEEGTEAAAASAGVVKLGASLPANKIDFVADHPFLFIISEDMTNVVLFIGHLLNPLAIVIDAEKILGMKKMHERETEKNCRQQKQGRRRFREIINGEEEQLLEILASGKWSFIDMTTAEK
ncbi:hypothetical protein U1Q18_016223 [Sarracenia purpurea var. burkii]